MSLNEKITFLNSLVDGTLTLIHYSKWELNSYEKDSMFCQRGSIGPVRAKDVAKCVDKALKLVAETMAND
jgi:hypothetical protein